ncbi:MAG: hypothetical protein WAM94_04045, partial [Chromatiaceae bacterium]
METLYRLVFNGELTPGADTEAVVAAFAKRFRVDESTARDVIRSRNRRVLKRDLDLQHMERYRSALEHIGLVVALERQDAEPLNLSAAGPDPEIAAAGIDAVPGATACPKCGA